MENNKTNILYGLGLLAIVVLVGAMFWFFTAPDTTPENPSDVGFVSNFDDCAAAGYPVMESYPRQCRTPDGQLYIESTPTNPVATATGGCYIGGCSSQICSDQPDMASTCEYRAEYSCYQTATCERQASGQCGWTQTAALSLCLTSSAGFGVDGK